jgi:hypothetical protein
MVALFAATAIIELGLTSGTTPCGEIALNPCKPDIFPYRRVTEGSLVGYGIDAMKGALNNEFRPRLGAAEREME